MPLLFEKLVQEDLNVGTDTTWVKAPGGGSLFATQVGAHSFARGLAEYEAEWTPGAIAAGSKASTTVTVPNAAVADYAWASHDKILTNALRVSAHVSAAGTAKVVIHNPTASSVTVPAGTVRVLIFPVLATTPPDPPSCNITYPTTGALGGTSVVIQVAAADAVYGIANVKIWYQYCPTSFSNCGATTLLTTLTSAPYNYNWTLPSCGACPESRFRITAEATSNSGTGSGLAGVDIVSTGRGC